PSGERWYPATSWLRDLPGSPAPCPWKECLPSGKLSFHMRFLEPLDDVFSGRSSIRVLRALVGLPADFGVSAREIARRAQVSHPTATKVLGTLVREGLVDMKRSPAGDEYSLRHEQILARELIRVFGIERGLLDNLRDFLGQAISPHAPEV